MTKMILTERKIPRERMRKAKKRMAE